MRLMRRAAGRAPVPTSATPPRYPGLAELLLPQHRSLADDPAFLDRLRLCAHPTFYAAQLDESDLESAGGSLDVEAAVQHFVATGARAGRRLCALFNPDWYAARLQAVGEQLPEGQVPFFHWLTVGWKRRIVPTPLFDPDSYLEHQPQLRNHPQWLFQHYLSRGCYQPTWTPSPTGQHHAGGKDDEAQRRQAPLFLPEMLHRADDFDLDRTSWLEEGVTAMLSKRQRLESGTMASMVAKAAELEPLIHRRLRGRTSLTSPVHRHPRLRVAKEAEAARAAIGVDHVDTIILVPHCRMGGAARVSGLFTHAVAAAGGPQNVLVVATDLPAIERVDWFPSDVPIFDLSPHVTGMSHVLRRAVLLDLVRGLAPKRVVNINSYLGWTLFTAFGGPLSALTDLGSYLFTWDLDPQGHPSGYPIMHFQRTFEHLSWVLFDSDRLRQELIDRYLMPPASQSRLVLARTPIPPSSTDVTGVFAQRRAQGAPLRALWAGRFDRQKRFDLVVDVARQLPDLEVWAWGKPVLDDLTIDLDDLPPNVRLMGVFEHFDELPLTDLDFMLYTSEWDGIPTLVLEAAQRGLPVVASSVGGVPEVVTDATAYPVADIHDGGAYVTAIKQLVADPQAATRRTVAMKELMADRFDPAEYQRIVDGLLDHSGSGST